MTAEDWKMCDLFQPYRALGLVSNELPLVVRYIKRRKENLIVTSVGNSFHTYGATKLKLLSVSNPLPSKISCLSADAYHIYTACDKIIYAWRRGTELKHKYVGHKNDIHIISPFGPHLISVDTSNSLHVWDIKDESLYMQKSFNNSTTISALLHPATYLNKLLIGTKQGKLILWNMKTNEDVYVFKGWGSEIVTMEQAPAIDVVAIGLANGRIILHNLKYDETIVEFKHDWGKVTGISFRTDGHPIMITGSEMGHIAIWDLQERKLISQIRDSHDGPVCGLKCLPNEPLLVTSSSDNTMKMWIFDLSDGGARLLKFRDGHGEPPLMARFHGSLGDTILSAGEDSVMRVFSTATDIINKSLGQASYSRKASKKSKESYEKLKMPPIIMFTSETAQEKSWDNIAAIHRRKTVVTTWSISQQKMGDHKLIHPRFKEQSLSNTVATCLDLSVCGNYVVVGYNSGHMDKYNIQSGIFRGSFGKPSAHSEAVMGVVIDGLNQFVLSGGQEGEIRWWRLKDCRGVKKVELSSGVSKMCLHKDSGLLAVGLDDWSINVIDSDTKAVVRKLVGHHNQITDLSFSPDSKWLISSSLDQSIRTWDLPSGKLVNWFTVPIPASSIAMSPIGDFLVTTHSGHLGICLWVNLSCYSHISLKPLSDDFKPIEVSLPSTAADESQIPAVEGTEKAPEQEVENDLDDEYKSPEQISESLVTLALIPTSRWLNLLNIDVIKKRNKPIEPPKIPKSAPFFLPSVPGLDFKFSVDDSNNDISSSRIKPTSSFEVLTPFGSMLKHKKYQEAIEMLMEMGPSSVDNEIRGLDFNSGGSKEVLLNFIEMVKFNLKQGKYFEAIEGYLGLFLKIHSEFIMEDCDAKESCYDLKFIHEELWKSVKSDVNLSLCLLSLFKNPALMSY